MLITRTAPPIPVHRIEDHIEHHLRGASMLADLAPAATPGLRPIDASAPPRMHEVWQRYDDAILSLPGVLSGGWRSAEPDRIHVSVATAELKFLLDQVLADQIDGVTIAVETSDRSGEPGPDSWVRSPTNVVRAIGGLPGVVDWERYDLTYMVYTSSQARREWLEPLIEHRVADRWVFVRPAQPES